MLCLHPCFFGVVPGLPLMHLINNRIQGVDMPSTSPDSRIRSADSGSSFGDDQIFARLHAVGIQAALSVLLSLFGLGPAMAQSIDPDMALAANTQATRDRVIAELRQARAEGTIKRWSPILVEVPFKAPLRGSRFEPFATHEADGNRDRFGPADTVVRSTPITFVAAHAAQ